MTDERIKELARTCPHSDTHREHGEIVCDDCNAVVGLVTFVLAEAIRSQRIGDEK